MIEIVIEKKKDRTYHKLGYYKFCEMPDIFKIEIDIKDLSKSSRLKIKVKCDICEKEKTISYYNYLKNIKKYNIYSCSEKCSSFKNRLTKKEKYGDENYNNRKKSKKTCIEKYGVENPQQCKDIKVKTINTNKIKYGGSSPRSSLKIQKKQKDTIIEKYGADYYVKWRESLKDILLNKYNDENYNNRLKVKETNLERYGVENAMSNEQIKQKMIQTKKDNGIYHTDEQRTEYKNYWLGVKRITNKHKKYLFENWDGIDFYDDENIENNFSLKSGDRLYPTIDHKISVKYGFENDISVEEIGDIKNLCITKRWINSSKNSKNTWTKYKKDF